MNSTTETLTPGRMRALASRANILDRDLLGFLRLSENDRTVQWLADAGFLDLNDALAQYEIQYCRHVIWQIPGFARVQIGETRFTRALRLSRSFRHSEPHRAPQTLPPPLPARFRK